MRYLVRSVKYLLFLVVLYIGLMALMNYTNTLAMPLEDTLYAQTHTWRGWVMLGAVVLLSATYPLFGFIRREVRGHINTHHAQIVKAFEVAGFRLCEEDGQRMIFRAEGVLKRLSLLYEDEIHVSQQGDKIQIEGIRRGVAKVVYRLVAYIENGQN